MPMSFSSWIDAMPSHSPKFPPSAYPCGVTRREFVWEMGGGFAGLALASLLAGDGFFGRLARAEAPPARGPLAPKSAHFVAKAKSCIFLMMNGGPSQIA